MHLPENVTGLCGQKRFSFACHAGLSCFNECCRELELALTPYDVLCLSRELRLSPSAFLERYALVEEDENGGFPMVYLGMVDDGRASCPFVSAAGCRVYNSRPGACRAYPVGRGVSLDGQGRVREMFVLVHENHCRGFAETGEQNAAEWFASQGLAAYNAVNDEILHLLHHEKVHQGRRFSRAEKDMFLMALYRVDEFRRQVSAPAFQARYGLSPEERHAVLVGDLELLRFAIRWLRRVLFAEEA